MPPHDEQHPSNNPPVPAAANYGSISPTNDAQQQEAECKQGRGGAYYSTMEEGGGDEKETARLLLNKMTREDSASSSIGSGKSKNNNNNALYSEYLDWKERETCKRRNRLSRRMGGAACLFLAVALGAPSVYILLRTHGMLPMLNPKNGHNTQRGEQEQVHHKETLPTLLSVVSPVTNDYVSALENDVYDSVRDAVFLNSQRTLLRQPSGSSGPLAQPPELHLDEFELAHPDSPFTLSWTRGTKEDGRSPIVTNDDILVLLCADELKMEDAVSMLSSSSLSYRNFLEVATIAQARTTSVRNGGRTGADEWYFPNFPVARKAICKFTLYQQQQGQLEPTLQQQEYQLMAESELLHLPYSTSPTAIHLALTSDPSVMTVSFVTSASVSGKPVVQYGAEGSMNLRAEGTTDTYTASDLCQAPANETEPGKFQSPGSLHTVRMTGLRPDTVYQYKVGFSHGQGITWSDTHHFTSAPEHGSSEPFSYLAFADQGCPAAGWGQGSLWTAAMLEREVNRAPTSSGTSSYPAATAVHHFGDLSYANGAAHIWDAWFAMIESYSVRVPLMIAVGNHEYDHTSGGGNGKDPSGVDTPHGFMPAWGNFADDSKGECGVPTAKRFTMPSSSIHLPKNRTIHSNGVFWYSYDYASVHTTVISSEHDLSTGSPQHRWLERDLAAVNRTKTPWLVVESHRPLYEGQAVWTQYSVGVGMRFAMEDLLRDYKVDVVLAGHYHAYHRTCDGLYRSQCNNGGPVHITIGTAGAAFEDHGIFENSWTAEFIKHEYGYGRITVANASAMLFEFVKVGDINDTDAGQSRDHIWILRDRSLL